MADATTLFVEIATNALVAAPVVPADRHSTSGMTDASGEAVNSAATDDETIDGAMLAAENQDPMIQRLTWPSTPTASTT